MWSKEHSIWLFVLACGLVLAWFGAVHPLLLADEGAEVRLYLKAAIAAPVAIVYGLLYVLAHGWATRRLGTRTKQTPLGLVVIGVLVVLGLALYVWVKSTLEGRGYRFDGL
ncbi:MAG: hypothetical protein L6Q95_11750 [Planctomycetes bacterium]|nr:hypothetical protein [Planctomycetota bacterium]